MQTRRSGRGRLSLRCRPARASCFACVADARVFPTTTASAIWLVEAAQFADLPRKRIVNSVTISSAKAYWQLRQYAMAVRLLLVDFSISAGNFFRSHACERKFSLAFTQQVRHCIFSNLAESQPSDLNMALKLGLGIRVRRSHNDKILTGCTDTWSKPNRDRPHMCSILWLATGKKRENCWPMTRLALELSRKPRTVRCRSGSLGSEASAVKPGMAMINS